MLHYSHVRTCTHALYKFRTSRYYYFPLLYTWNIVWYNTMAARARRGALVIFDRPRALRSVAIFSHLF